MPCGCDYISVKLWHNHICKYQQEHPNTFTLNPQIYNLILSDPRHHQFQSKSTQFYRIMSLTKLHYQSIVYKKWVYQCVTS